MGRPILESRKHPACSPGLTGKAMPECPGVVSQPRHTPDLPKSPCLRRSGFRKAPRRFSVAFSINASDESSCAKQAQKRILMDAVLLHPMAHDKANTSADDSESWRQEMKGLEAVGVDISLSDLDDQRGASQAGFPSTPSRSVWGLAGWRYTSCSNTG